jgi:acetamidase/formamidase
MKFPRIAATLVGALALIGQGVQAQSVVPSSRMPGKVHVLPATLETAQWGWFDSSQKPVLTINSGDTVVMETMMASHNLVVPGMTIEEMMKLRVENPGRGPHSVTGPIYVNGAEPGDAIKIDINRIVPRAYALNFNLPGSVGAGQFPKEFQNGRVRYVYLDMDKKVTEFLPGVYVPLRPFPGTLGVARKEAGRFSTVQPGDFGGNMDIRELVEGTSLYLPVHRSGALLWTGDSHAGQGNGEINLTALETAFKEFKVTITVLKNNGLEFPRMETPKSWVTMGFDTDLNKAWDGTREQTLKLIAEQRKLSGTAAEALMAKATDCRVSQVVNVKKGVHCMTAKSQLGADDMARPTSETKNDYVTHAANEDLNTAMYDASMAMIDLIEKKKGIDRLDAYGLASVAMDCRLGAMSGAKKNVHCLLAKSLWQAPK